MSADWCRGWCELIPSLGSRFPTVHSYVIMQQPGSSYQTERIDKINAIQLCVISQYIPGYIQSIDNYFFTKFIGTEQGL